MQLFLHQSQRVAILKLYNSSIDTLQISNFTTYSQNSHNAQHDKRIRYKALKHDLFSHTCCKNDVVIFLFATTKHNLKKAFSPESSSFLQNFTIVALNTINESYITHPTSL